MPFMSDTTEELRVLNAKEQQIILLVALAEFFTCFNFVVYFSFNDAIVHAFFPKDLDDELKQLGFFGIGVYWLCFSSVGWYDICR